MVTYMYMYLSHPFIFTYTYNLPHTYYGNGAVFTVAVLLHVQVRTNLNIKILW